MSKYYTIYTTAFNSSKQVKVNYGTYTSKHVKNEHPLWALISQIKYTQLLSISKRSMISP